MIIKNIVLKDFRQYKGKQDIKFSTDNEKNVTVILGLNTSGKTTLIEAFKWCLYDITTYPKRDLINIETAQELNISEKGQIYVEITLVHGNIEYIIKRIQNYFKSDKDKMTLKDSRLSVSYKEKSGELKQVRELEIQDVINTILPVQLSDYFFFDGERIGDIGNRSDIKNAVQGLMGLDVITEAKKSLDPKRKNSVINRLESKLDIGTDQNSEHLTQDISREQDEIEKYREKLIKVEEEIKYFEKEFKQISDKITANQSVKEKQRERSKLEQDVEKQKLKLLELNKRIKEDFINRSFEFFAIPLIEKSMNTLNSTKEEIEGIAGMSAKAIDHIINRGICICGNRLEFNCESHNNVLNEKKLLPPYHIGTMVNETKTSYKIVEDRGYKFKNDIIMDFKRYETFRNEISDNEKRLENISEILKGNIDVGQLERDRNKYKDKIIDLKNKRDSTLVRIGSYENSIETLRNRKASLVIVSSKNDEINKCIAYSNVLFDFFTENYKSKEKIVKTSLEENVNEIFNSIYHGQRYVRIDEDYKVSLDVRVSKELVETSMSKGLEAVKNFSFVAGLVKIAKEKVKDKEDICTEEPYPLVMDAPFSNVDEIHISSISKILPTVSEQVIWILMEKDWNYAKKSLNGKVGYIYDIEKVNNSETYSIVKGRESYV